MLLSGRSLGILTSTASQRYLFNELFDHLSLLSAFFISDGHFGLQYVDLALKLVDNLRILLLSVQVIACSDTMCNATQGIRMIRLLI